MLNYSSNINANYYHLLHTYINDAMIASVYTASEKFMLNSLFDFLTPLSELLRSNSAVFVTFSVIFGLLVGSFLNVVIHRLPKMMEREWHANCLELQGRTEDLTQGELSVIPAQTKYNIVTPRSACPKCGHHISAIENIPVISYLLLGGKCKSCKTSISLRYPFIEALTGALIGAVAYQYGFTATTFFAWILVFALVTLTFIDFDTQLLPDDITLPLLWLGLILNMNGGFADNHANLNIDLKSAVLGAIFGYLILWLVYWAFKLVTGKEGMGYGDFKLLAAIGAWFGWQMLPAVILLSSVAGAVIGIGLIVFKGKGGGTAIPFGPFLALGGIAALFFGAQLMHLYFPN